MRDSGRIIPAMLFFLTTVLAFTLLPLFDSAPPESASALREEGTSPIAGSFESAVSSIGYSEAERQAYRSSDSVEENRSRDSDRTYGDTDEFRNFLKLRRRGAGGERRQDVDDQTDEAQGFRYSCRDGVLVIATREGKEIWRSDPYWYVDRFVLFDVDRDGVTDCLYTLWKSYSFVRGSIVGQDDPAVKQHLFYSTIRSGRVKMEWCSSNLPRPIYDFRLSEGTPTPAFSGTVLDTVEGRYTEDFTETESIRRTYIWEGWGFVLQDPEKSGR